MSPERYAELKRQGYHRIPLCRTLLADTETPLSTYLKLANQPGSYLFESVVGGETWGRYSIIGLPCQQFIRVNQGVIRVENAVGDVLSEVQPNDPLAWIEQFQQQFNVPELSQLPRYYGGLVGYFGYNTIRYIEPRLGPATLPSNFDQPDILLMVSEEVVVFDNLRSQMHLVVLTDPLQANAYEQGQHRLTTLHQELCAAAPVVANYALPDAEPALPELTSNLSFEQYSQALAQAKSYILNGDIMQVVFARELAGELNVSALELYRALRHLNPAPYLYYLSYPDGFQVVGSSPEILARVENRRVTVRPIAGTRPRGQDVAEDLALEHELLHDPKEIAEHLMLIDLGRNDVSRVAEVGSVKLTEKMVIERYSQVMHIVSNVEAILKSGCSAMDVLLSLIHI